MGLLSHYFAQSACLPHSILEKGMRSNDWINITLVLCLAFRDGYGGGG